MRYQYSMRCLDCEHHKVKWIGYHRTNAAGVAQAHADYNKHTVTLIAVDMQTLTCAEEQLTPDQQFLF